MFSDLWKKISMGADYVVAGFAKIFLFSLVLWMLGLLWILVREVASDTPFSLREYLRRVFRVLIFSLTWGAYMSAPIAAVFLWYSFKGMEKINSIVLFIDACFWAYIIFHLHWMHRHRWQKYGSKRPVGEEGERSIRGHEKGEGFQSEHHHPVESEETEGLSFRDELGESSLQRNDGFSADSATIRDVIKGPRGSGTRSRTPSRVAARMERKGKRPLDDWLGKF